MMVQVRPCDVTMSHLTLNSDLIINIHQEEGWQGGIFTVLLLLAVHNLRQSLYRKVHFRLSLLYQKHLSIIRRLTCSCQSMISFVLLAFCIAIAEQAYDFLAFYFLYKNPWTFHKILKTINLLIGWKSLRDDINQSREASSFSN